MRKWQILVFAGAAMACLGLLYIGESLQGLASCTEIPAQSDRERAICNLAAPCAFVTSGGLVIGTLLLASGLRGTQGAGDKLAISPKARRDPTLQGLASKPRGGMVLMVASTALLVPLYLSLLLLEALPKGMEYFPFTLLAADAEAVVLSRFGGSQRGAPVEGEFGRRTGAPATKEGFILLSQLGVLLILVSTLFPLLRWFHFGGLVLPFIALGLVVFSSGHLGPRDRVDLADHEDHLDATSASCIKP